MNSNTSSKRLLLPLGLAAALSLFGDLTLFATLVTQLEVVHLSVAEVGILLSVHRLVRIPGNPLAGALMDRFGRRPLFLVGMLLAVTSTAGYGFASGFWPFLLCRVGWGAAWALINVGGMTMILDVTSNSNRGRLTGLYNTWINIGYAAGPLLGGFLVDSISFRWAMLSLAACSALGLAAALFFLPETRPLRPAAPAARVPLAERLLALWRSSRDVLAAHPELRAAMLLFAVNLFAWDGIVLSTVAVLLEQRLGEQIALGGFLLGVSSASGLLLAARSILAALAGPAAGHLSDRRLGRVPLILASLIVGIAGFILLAYAATLPSILAGVALGALSGSAALTTLAAYTGDHTPANQQGAVMGAYATAGDMGSTLGPALAFALLPILGLRGIYLISAGLFALGLIVLQVSRRASPPLDKV